MPPTDMVKKLSRTDHLINSFKEFLQIQGIITEGDRDILLNPMPYTMSVATVDRALGKVDFYRCFATSVCMPDSSSIINRGRSIRYTNVLFTGRGDLWYIIKNNSIYLYDLQDTTIDILFPEVLTKIKLMDKTFRCKDVNIVNEGIGKYLGIYAASFFSTKFLLSIASVEPISVNIKGRYTISLNIPISTVVLVTNKTYMQVFRETYGYTTIVNLKGSIRKEQPLIEVLDPITLAIPLAFDGGCMDMMLVNPEPIDYNAMIKVYGYIDELVVDDMVRFKPKYSIIRLALPGYGSSKIRLCISTYIPRRANLILRFKNSS